MKGLGMTLPILKIFTNPFVIRHIITAYNNRTLQWGSSAYALWGHGELQVSRRRKYRKWKRELLDKALGWLNEYLRGKWFPPWSFIWGTLLRQLRPYPTLPFTTLPVQSWISSLELLRTTLRSYSTPPEEFRETKIMPHRSNKSRFLLKQPEENQTPCFPSKEKN